MNNLNKNEDQRLLGAELSTTMLKSPSVGTFLPDENESTCPLLSSTPSPPPNTFSHPLTPVPNDDFNNQANCKNIQQDLNLSELDVTDTTSTVLFNAYQHIGNNSEINKDVCKIKENGILNIPITKDTPNFVSWNWPLIRKLTFCSFMSMLLAMCAVIIAMIYNLPKSCNPKNEWYKGIVFYEIFPASFQDSNSDGIGDIRGILSRIDYLEQLGIGAIRLNSIFSSEHYPDNYDNVTSLLEINKLLGNINDLDILINALHSRNISIVLDLPIFPFLKKLEDTIESLNLTLNENYLDSKVESLDITNTITQAILYWISKGIDGFYIKGIEHFYNDPNLLGNIIEWKYILSEKRALLISNNLLEQVDNNIANKIVKYVDLVDVYLNISNGTSYMDYQIKNILSGILMPSEKTPWIHWSLGSVSRKRISTKMTSNATLAAIIMQLMLPGSPSIFYGDEIFLKESHDPYNEHKDSKHLHHLAIMEWGNKFPFTTRNSIPWLPRSSANFRNFIDISKTIQLRYKNPSIYQNSICKQEQILLNINVKHSKNDIIILERWYPRRNSFASISNFGSKTVSMDLTSIFYSGNVMVGRTRTEKIYFNDFEIRSMETIIVKLDK